MFINIGMKKPKQTMLTQICVVLVDRTVPFKFEYDPCLSVGRRYSTEETVVMKTCVFVNGRLDWWAHVLTDGL